MERWTLGGDSSSDINKNKKKDDEDINFILDGFNENINEQNSGMKQSSAPNGSKSQKKNYSRDKEAKRSSSQKILYVFLFIAAVISIYYVVKTLYPNNDIHIKIFNLKTKLYRSKILPENNLLITGFLSNNNKVPIGFVKLKCNLYSSKNIILATKYVYAGNFININKLKTMSNTSINRAFQNKNGKSMSDLEILPQHPIKFMVVFLNVPTDTKNFSITVSHFYAIKKK
jgi:cell division protein FtsL